MKAPLMALLVTLAAGCVSGCASFDGVDATLQPLKGQSLDHAISVLGYPQEDKVIAGRRLVIWRSARATTGLTVGQVGSQQVLVTSPAEARCEVTLEVDGGGVVRGGQYRGNSEGCATYAKH